MKGHLSLSIIHYSYDICRILCIKANIQNKRISIILQVGKRLTKEWLALRMLLYATELKGKVRR